jgi:ABC-type sugar transport system ATPase subunit
VIAFNRISKRFPGALALDDVSFEVARASCHALLGENGAGKSTLGKILAGIYRPEGGQITIDGTPVVFASPREAMLAGVGIVHQELVFCPNLSVAENLCLHDLPRRAGRLDRAELRRKARAMLDEIGLAIDVDRSVASLSIAQEQLVQIAAAVGLGAKVLVFDEPTSSLGPAEVERLFALVRRLQQSGTTIIYVSHRLEEIFALCDTVTVLRNGKHVATKPIGDVNHDALVQMMVGRDLDLFAPSATRPPGEPRLKLQGFSSPPHFDDVRAEVRAGEIVGIAGLVGAGRTELLEAIYGLHPDVRGDITLDGQPALCKSPRAAQSLGIALVPEDRKRQGLVLSTNVRENLTLPILDRFRRLFGRADRRAETVLARQFCQQLAVRTPGTEAAVNHLSGGNQQKIVIAKAVASDAKLLLVDEPTRGVDVGAKKEIHDLLGQLARQGTAILVVSSDLPELLSLADRILVLRTGRLVATLAREQAQPDVVLRHMAGIGDRSGSQLQ